MASIGENIRVLRLARGWTQEQLAEKLHMTRQAVGHYESGRTTPDVETCRRLAALFEVELEVLLEGEGEPAKLPRWLFSLTLGAAGLFPLVRSVLMVVNQHLYPVAQGQISSGSKEWEIAQKHFALSRAADAVETAGYVVFLAVLVVLVLWEIRQRQAVPWRQKLALWGLVAVVTVVTTYLPSLFDPVYGAANYLIPASHITARFGIALAVAWIIRKVQKR